jgi:hypothetical protein
VTVHLDVRRAADDYLVFVTAPRTLTFARRTRVLEVAWRIEGAVFPSPGVYLVELHCNNNWVGDVAVHIGGGVR